MGSKVGWGNKVTKESCEASGGVQSIPNWEESAAKPDSGSQRVEFKRSRTGPTDSVMADPDGK